MKIKIATLILSMALPVLALGQTPAPSSLTLEKADEYFHNGQYKEATEIYLELYGDSGEALYEQRLDASKKCQSLFKKAEEAERWGDSREALDNYEEILALNPSDKAVAEKIDALKQKLGLAAPAAPAAPAVAPAPAPSASESTPKETLPANPPRPVAPVPPVTKGSIGGHQYVDLGLPSGLKWATCNMGASQPSDHGDYYSWGETAVKPRYEYAKARMNGTKVSDISGTSQYDAARAKWGGSWRLPTGKEIEELIANCTWTTTKEGGRTVLKGTGRNGNSIILPATGYREDGEHYRASDSGYCWSSSNWNYSDTAGALSYSVDGNPVLINFDYYFGMPIRPVTE